MNIILIGFMGSGKSSVGQRLSRLLQLPCVEMDTLVCQKTGAKNMHEVFARGGELLLRETEIAIAKEYASKENHIISTGGGVVHNKIIFDYFRKKGAKVIYLHASYETLAQRLARDSDRPLLSQAKQLYDVRLPLYHYFADHVIEVSAVSEDKVAKQIQQMVKSGL